MKNPESLINKKWYVIYTRSRAEKKVLDEMNFKNIECFLPLQKKLRQWKDRKKWVEMPLIPGYAFVHINRKEYDKVLQTNHVVGYVRFEGKAAIIPDEQIYALKQMITQFDVEVDVSDKNFTKGKKIEIIAGPLMGLRGELTEIRGKNRFIVRIVHIKTTFSVELSPESLSYIPFSG
jgi:transcription antitermination factor NusG